MAVKEDTKGIRREIFKAESLWESWTIKEKLGERNDIC